MQCELPHGPKPKTPPMTPAPKPCIYLSRVIVRGLYQIREFPYPDPSQALDFPVGLVHSAYWGLHSPQKEDVYVNYPSFFIFCSCNTWAWLILANQLLRSPFVCLIIFLAFSFQSLNLFCGGTWKGEEGQERIQQPPQVGTWLHFPPAS